MKRTHIFMVVGMLLFAATAHAAADPSASLGLGTRLMQTFAEVLSSFESVLRAAAKNLFWLLAIIELGAVTVKRVLHDEWTIERLFMDLAWRILIWGFFYWLLVNSHWILSSIIDSFFKLGTDATGLKTLDATGLLGIGIKTTLSMVEQAGLGALDFLDKPLIVLTALIAELLLLAAFVVVAFQLVMAQVEAMIVLAAAPVLAAFGALSHTRDIASNVLKHALSTGVKILTIYIIAGVMVKIGPAFAAVMKSNGAQIFSSPGQLLEIIGVAFLMLLLAFFIPTVASSMLSGSSGLSGTAALGAAMGAAAAAATGGAAAIGGGGAAVGALGNVATGGAAGVAGLAKAMGSGMSSGLDLGKSGLGAAAHAVGEVAKHGMGIGAGAIGDAVNKAGGAFSERVANSTGSKIASSIEATRGGSMSGAGTSSGAGGAPQGKDEIPDYKQLMAEAAERAVPPPSSSGPTSNASSTAAPSVGMGDASGASVGGPASGGDKPRSTLGRLADGAQRALDGTGGLMQQGREHIVDDRTQVAASIDTRAHL